MKIEMTGITKRFPGVIANQRVDLTVDDGEIHALLGENGSGKSTLMKILFGLSRPDRGRITIDGNVVRIDNPGDAIALGIAMVHQHSMGIPAFTVTENIILGKEKATRSGRIDLRSARLRVLELSEEFGLEVDPDARVEDLPLGVQQRVEVLRALYRDVSCLILDEPTAVLTPPEVEKLESMMSTLAASGRSVIFITHKLDEAVRVSDRITVLRQGRVVGSLEAEATDVEQLATLMVGRPIERLSRPVGTRTPDRAGPDRLTVEGLSVDNGRGGTAVDDVSFTVRSGEILAVAGVQGNGQSELVEALTGLRAPVSGTVLLDGVNVTGAAPAKLFRSGVGHIPEDRRRSGLVGQLSVQDNLVLNTFSDARFSSRGVRRLGSVRSNAVTLCAEFDIRSTSVDTRVSDLSGGNQQKVILARELGNSDRLLVAAHPTRGLDVGSLAYVHRRLTSARDDGTAILLVSGDIDEVLDLADRIAVMVSGRLIAVEERRHLDRHRLGLMIAGITATAATAKAVCDREMPQDG